MDRNRFANNNKTAVDGNENRRHRNKIQNRPSLSISLADMNISKNINGKSSHAARVIYIKLLGFRLCFYNNLYHLLNRNCWVFVSTVQLIDSIVETLVFQIHLQSFFHWVWFAIFFHILFQFSFSSVSMHISIVQTFFSRQIQSILLVLSK